MLQLNIEYCDPFEETFKTLSELWVTRQIKMGSEMLLLSGSPKYVIDNIRQWGYRNWNLIDYDKLLMNDLVINGSKYVYYNGLFSEYYMDRLINHASEWVLHPKGFIWISDIKRLCKTCGCPVDEFKERAVELMHDTGYDDYTIDTFDQLFNQEIESENRKQLIKWRDQYANK